MKLIILCSIMMLSMASYIASKLPALSYPDYFNDPMYDFSTNPLDTHVIALGRSLFYDPILSRDQTISCASCHSPYNAFAHTDHDLSHGIHDSIGQRNAPALFNLAWQRSFMWDGAVHHLDMQPLAPINHPGEMGSTTADVINKLNQSSLYRTYFFHAFGDSVATGERMLKALAQFQLTLISSSAKYDAVRQGRASFTDQEQNGYSVFKRHCNSCHTEPLFSNYGFANNGLPVDTTLNDFGKWKITHRSEDSLLFKIPSLRNLSYTYPYMHDGRFKKLHQVLNHYAAGIMHSPTLAQELQRPIQFTPTEKADLIAFLLTLNDSSFVFNPQHQFPRHMLQP